MEAPTFKKGCAEGQSCNGHLAAAGEGLDVFVLCVPTCRRLYGILSIGFCCCGGFLFVCFFVLRLLRSTLVPMWN